MPYDESAKAARMDVDAGMARVIVAIQDLYNLPTLPVKWRPVLVDSSFEVRELAKKIAALMRQIEEGH